MYCGNCGKEYTEGSVFCRWCGEKLSNYECKNESGNVIKAGLGSRDPVEMPGRDTAVPGKNRIPAAVYVLVAVILAVFLSAVIIIPKMIKGKNSISDESSDNFEEYSEIKENVGEDNEASGDAAVATGDETDIEDEAVADDGWKRAYLNLLFQYGSEGDYLNDGEGTTVSFYYLDEDGIPEMSVVTGSAGPSTHGAIYSYVSGDVVRLCSADSEVIYGEGLILEYIPYDSMGSSDDAIFSWNGKTLEHLWSGSVYADDTSFSNRITRTYTLDGKNVTEEEYYNAMDSYFDRKKAVSTGQDMRFEEAVSYLSEALWEDEVCKDWKQAYLKTVKENIEWGYDSGLCWGLLFIDDDDIPELIMDTGTTAGGESVYTYVDGESAQIYYAYSGMSFIPIDGLIYGFTGHGVNNDTVIKLSGGDTVLVWEGVEDFYESYMGNFDAKPVYYSNSKEVSEEQFIKDFSDAFPYEKAFWLENPSFYYNSIFEKKDGAIPGMTTDQIIAFLTTLSPPEGLDSETAQAFIDVINGNMDDAKVYSYNLIYLDNDEVPEFVVFYDDPDGVYAQFDTERFDIYRYQGGKAVLIKSVKPYETDGFGDFYLKNNTFYYEKMDYLSAVAGWEGIDDDSSGYVYFRAVDASEPVYVYLEGRTVDYATGNEVRFDEWYRDGDRISEDEYKNAVNILPLGKDIRDGSLGRGEMTGLLWNAK